jgi:hypothetical protein
MILDLHMLVLSLFAGFFVFMTREVARLKRSVTID